MVKMTDEEFMERARRYNEEMAKIDAEIQQEMRKEEPDAERVRELINMQVRLWKENIQMAEEYMRERGADEYEIAMHTFKMRFMYKMQLEGYKFILQEIEKHERGAKGIEIQ